jgi:uroporphyrin-III C-methyltransferase/precorrin-2 dehydrogenase/sirohydrochlorin ferrochelatase
LSSEEQQNSPLFPAFLKLAGRKALLVGGGRVAVTKHAALRAAGADVTVVAPRIDPALRQPGTAIVERAFAAGDLDGVWFVVAAATPEVNRAVAAAAEERRVFVNAVDDPAVASAYAGGVVRRGDVTIAISTGGDAPALSGLLREALDAVLPPELASWADTARTLRARWRQDQVPMHKRRPQLLEALNRLYDEREEVHT